MNYRNRTRADSRCLAAVAQFLIATAVCLVTAGAAYALELPWYSPQRHRIILDVDSRGVIRSNSPAEVEMDFRKVLSENEAAGRFDEHTIEVVAYDSSGLPRVFDETRRGYERHLMPWRLDKHYGADAVTLHFVIPDEACTQFAVYFDTIESGLGRSERYPGLVGDGDFFREGYKRREIGAHHFDCFADLDADGDLDLFKGGVEPFIYVYENVGGNRFVDRGRLTSGGKLFTLPKNDHNNRSWVVPHFYDWDEDGDLDFFPSFMDGPYAGKVVWFENKTVLTGQLTFLDKGPVKTVSGIPVAGGEQAGGWFPSVVFVKDFDGDNDDLTDIILGYNNRCYLYRNLGRDDSGGWRLGEAVTIQADGKDIELFNPCYDLADIDNDGDWDLFAAPQAGEILFYENVDDSAQRNRPTFAKGVVIAHDDLYVQPSGHPRLKVADFTGDGLPDFVVDRAWELTDLNHPQKRDYGALFENVGTKESAKWARRDAHYGAPYTEEFQICDAIRQNVVRAVDWNNDGKRDLIAGDCDGFIWYFHNTTNNLAPVFAGGVKLSAGGEVLSLAANSGHARPDICDWNGDGRKDIVASDGVGTVTVYLNEGSDAEPVLGSGRKVKAVGPEGEVKPIDRGTRSHIMVCDWNNNGKQDIIFSDQENPGFYFFKNIGEGEKMVFASAENVGLGDYVRPNLGSFVDWDGDGKKDFIGCEFEHSIRFYKNVGSGKPGEEPKFADAQGVKIVKPYSIMMISGADAVDFNGDGDIDIVTGQGHGGSGIRFYERDYIEDSLNNTFPIVTIRKTETRATVFLDVVRRYADAMMEYGRDTYGEKRTGLFLSALDRRQLKPLSVRPTPPGGIRRGDRAGLPWRKLVGANPQVDENLLRVLYVLSRITGENRYKAAADREIEWFFKNAQSPVTGLLPWGEHLSWHVFLDRPISSGTELTHEFARPWVLWDKSFELAPEASKRFALGLWNHQIADQKTGAFDRHAPYDRHGPRDGKDFARHAGFYIHTWAHAYKHTEDPVFLPAIDSLLARFERKRRGAEGKEVATIGPLDIETAASMVPEPLASKLRKFADKEDGLILDNLRGKYAGPDGTWAFEPTWQAGYAAGVTADWAMFA
ncbi:MAG: FG-GAP repeat domain-containing protein, partial [Planctomycetota bacterium]